MRKRTMVGMLLAMTGALYAQSLEHRGGIRYFTGRVCGFTASASSDVGTAAVGDAVTFSVVLANGTAPYTYEWNFSSQPYLGTVPTTSYWKLEETGASDRVDAVGGHNLTATGAPTNVTAAFGGLGNNFNEPAGQWLGVAHHADLQGGDVDLSIAGWLQLDGPTIDQYAVIGINNEWKVFVSGFGSYTNYLRFGWWKGDGTFISTPVTSAELNGRPLIFFHAWRDMAGQTINLQIESETLATTSSTGGGQVGALQFEVAALDGVSGAAKIFDGILDELYLYRGLWSAEEVLNLRGRSGVAGPVWKYTTSGAKTITLRVVDANNCTASDSVEVTVS